MIVSSILCDKHATVTLNCEEIRKLNDLLTRVSDENDYEKLSNEFSNLYDLIKHGNLDEFISKYKIKGFIDHFDKD